MGSKTYDGVQFFAYTNDHPPPHVHGFYAEVEVIIELDFLKKKAVLAKREDRIEPRNAKKSDVRRILRVARKHIAEVVTIWEAAHESMDSRHSRLRD